MVDKKEVRKKLKRANSRLAHMRKKGLSKLSVIPLALREHAKITGVMSETFKMGRKPDTKTLEKLDRQLDQFLKSKWTTEKGRNEIYEKRLKTFATDKELLLERDLALKLFDVFSTDIYEIAKEKGLLDSTQLIELIKNEDNVNDAEDFEQAIQSAYELSKKNGYDVADGVQDIETVLEQIRAKKEKNNGT
jgi:hypothetical protein